MKTHNHLTGCGGSCRPQPHVARAPNNSDTGDGARLDAGRPRGRHPRASVRRVVPAFRLANHCLQAGESLVRPLPRTEPCRRADSPPLHRLRAGPGDRSPTSPVRRTTATRGTAHGSTRGGPAVATREHQFAGSARLQAGESLVRPVVSNGALSPCRRATTSPAAAGPGDRSPTSPVRRTTATRGTAHGSTRGGPAVATREHPFAGQCQPSGWAIIAFRLVIDRVRVCGPNTHSRRYLSLRQLRTNSR